MIQPPMQQKPSAGKISTYAHENGQNPIRHEVAERFTAKLSGLTRSGSCSEDTAQLSTTDL